MLASEVWTCSVSEGRAISVHGPYVSVLGGLELSVRVPGKPAWCMLWARCCGTVWELNNTLLLAMPRYISCFPGLCSGLAGCEAG